MLLLHARALPLVTALLLLACATALALQQQPVQSIPHASTPAAASTLRQDCQLRAFTLEIVHQLATSDTTGDWTGSAYSALQLARCNQTLPELVSAFPIPAVSPRQQLRTHYPREDTDRLNRDAAADCSWEVFVDPVGGSDGNDGSVSAPLSSIHRALSLSRTVPRSPSAASRTACITLRGGRYFLGRNASSLSPTGDSRIGAIALTPADSGLTIRAFQGENVTVSGGIALPPLQWKSWRQSALVASLASVSIPALDRWHLNELYVDGRRAVPAKYPNGDPATSGLWNQRGWLSGAKGWAAVKPFPPSVEIHVASPQRPNSHFTAYQMGVGGPAAPFNPPKSFWAAGPYLYTIPTGLIYGDELRQRVGNWSDPSTGLVFAFHGGHWASWVFDIAGVDAASSSILFGRGGQQEARGNSDGAEYYVSRILEELDDADEWFVDYAGSGTLYFQPNQTRPGELVVSQLPCIISVQGTQANPVTNVEISGLTLTHTASTFMRDYEVPSGGDWSVHRGGAVYLEGTRFTSIKGCTFTQLGGNAVVISDYNEGVDVGWNEFSWLGESAVVIVGSVSGIDGVSNRDVPRFTNVFGNLFHELGAYTKQTAAVVQFLSAQSFIGHNAIFNVPRAGINLNDGYYGGGSIVGNVIFNTVRETSDHGPINSWDRIPYLVDTGSGPSMRPLVTAITANLLFNNYVSVWPIDHDDGSAFYDDSYNVLLYGGYKNVSHAPAASSARAA